MSLSSSRDFRPRSKLAKLLRTKPSPLISSPIPLVQHDLPEGELFKVPRMRKPTENLQVRILPGVVPLAHNLQHGRELSRAQSTKSPSNRSGHHPSHSSLLLSPSPSHSSPPITGLSPFSPLSSLAPETEPSISQPLPSPSIRQKRRQAATFSKVTVKTADSVEHRYIYATLNDRKESRDSTQSTISSLSASTSSESSSRSSSSSSSSSEDLSSDTFPSPVSMVSRLPPSLASPRKISNNHGLLQLSTDGVSSMEIGAEKLQEFLEEDASQLDDYIDDLIANYSFDGEEQGLNQEGKMDLESTMLGPNFYFRDQEDDQSERPTSLSTSSEWSSDSSSDPFEYSEYLSARDKNRKSVELEPQNDPNINPTAYLNNPLSSSTNTIRANNRSLLSKPTIVVNTTNIVSESNKTRRPSEAVVSALEELKNLNDHLEIENYLCPISPISPISPIGKFAEELGLELKVIQEGEAQGEKKESRPSEYNQEEQNDFFPSPNDDEEDELDQLFKDHLEFWKSM